MSTNPVIEYGFTAVPASASQLLDDATTKPSSPPPAYALSAFPIPDTALAKRIQVYAKSHLPEPTYNHSMRVYYFGQAMRRYRFARTPRSTGGSGDQEDGSCTSWPSAWAFSDETYFLSCLLHDIGTTEENLRKTRLSFEFYGGLLALELLQHDVNANASNDRDRNNLNEEAIAPRAQAESVAEAIIRHQDLCERGNITAVGQLIQLATIFDNTGAYAELVHADTIEAVSRAFPRRQWSSCFAATIQQENGLKPWAHTTSLGEEEFPAKVLGNELMAGYE